MDTEGPDRLIVKNWNKFQHYKHRNPPWIRLHRSILDDAKFQCLPIASRALAPMLWLLASGSIQGSIDLSFDELAFRLRTSTNELQDAIKPLLTNGFFICSGCYASIVLASCKQNSSTEYRVQSTEKENTKATRVREPHSNDGNHFHFSGTKLRITTEEHQVFTKAFEGTDLAAEYLKMDSWLVANHRNYRAFGRFANTWLSRVKIPHLGGSNGESAHLARTKRTLETARRMLESANGRTGEISLTLSPGTN